MNRISIVITCYREGPLLRRAVRSLDAQTDRDYELLIVNDASPDEETNDICRKLESDGRARVIWRKTNGGLSASRNSGFENMKGDIYVALDADDELPRNAIESIRYGFDTAPESDFVFGNYIRREIEQGTEELVDCSGLSSTDGFLDPRTLVKCWLLYGGSPCRKTMWQKVGGYDGEFSYGGQDVDFWKRAFLVGSKGRYVNNTIYCWNRSQAGLNATVPVKTWRRVEVKNIAFSKKFGGDIVEKKVLLLFYFFESDHLSCRRLAGELLKSGHFSVKVILLAFCPGLCIQLYRLRGRKIFKPVYTLLHLSIYENSRDSVV